MPMIMMCRVTWAVPPQFIDASAASGYLLYLTIDSAAVSTLDPPTQNL